MRAFLADVARERQLCLVAAVLLYVYCQQFRARFGNPEYSLSIFSYPLTFSDSSLVSVCTPDVERQLWCFPRLLALVRTPQNNLLLFTCSSTTHTEAI